MSKYTLGWWSHCRIKWLIYCVDKLRWKKSRTKTQQYCRDMFRFQNICISQRQKPPRQKQPQLINRNIHFFPTWLYNKDLVYIKLLLHHFAWLPHTIHIYSIFIFSIWSLMPLLPLNISASPTQAFEDRIYITGDKGDAQMGTVLALKSWPWWSKAAVKILMSNIPDAILPKSQNKALQFALGWTTVEKFPGTMAAKSKNVTWKALYMIPAST